MSTTTQRLLACALALSVLLFTTAESCEDKKRNARQPGGALPPTIVVTFTASSTEPGFEWAIIISGPNYRERHGIEKTRDMSAQRIEVVKGKDILVTFTVTAPQHPLATKECKMTVNAGRVVRDESGIGTVVCVETVPALFNL